MGGINFFNNLPVMIFALVFALILIIFIVGLVRSVISKSQEGKEKGRKTVILSLIFFFLLLMGYLVFVVLTYYLKNQNSEPGDPEAFPPSPSLGNFPAAPSFIKLGNFYFLAPQLLTKASLPTENSLFAVLCAKDEDYTVLYIGEANLKSKSLASSESAECWSKECGKDSTKKLYLAYLPVPASVYNSKAVSAIKKELISDFNPLCVTK